MNRQDYLKIVLGFLVLAILAYVTTTVVKMCKKKENFTSSCPYKNKHPDVITKEYLNSQDEEGMMGEMV